MAMTDPDLLVLFEDWFEELEEEIISLVNRCGPLDAAELARRAGLSLEGQHFFSRSSSVKESFELQRLAVKKERLLCGNMKTTFIAITAGLLTVRAVCTPGCTEHQTAAG